MNADFQVQQAGAVTGRLVTPARASEMIWSGECLSISGVEALLRQLPQGNWIGGTIPYFMGENGGEVTTEKLLVTRLPHFGAKPQIKFYDERTIDQVCVDAPANGVSIIIIPAFGNTHAHYAMHAPNFPDMFMKPIVGWISGVALDQIDKVKPGVMNGQTLGFDHERAVVMHLPLPDDLFAHIDIINVFRQGDGDIIRFPRSGWSARECLVNGKAANFADYLTANGIDTVQPLVADYSGALVNVSLRTVDQSERRVDFFAPVSDDVEYRFAAPCTDYVSAFSAALPDDTSSLSFCCNCVLNYFKSDLEGKSTGTLTGPMTFGEIAYQLLNQTMVYLSVRA